MNADISSFLIMSLGCGIAYYMFGPVGLGIIALFLLLKTRG